MLSFLRSASTRVTQATNRLFSPFARISSFQEELKVTDVTPPVPNRSLRTNFNEKPKVLSFAHGSKKPEPKVSRDGAPSFASVTPQTKKSPKV